MRIIGGKWKGKSLPGQVHDGVRPTGDRAREMMFSILEHITDVEGKRIADVCAGTGALGFECLSRGATHCTFFEKNKDVVKCINENATHLNADLNSFIVVPGDIKKTLLTVPSQYDIIITDPPYSEKIINPLLRVIVKKNLLVNGGVFIAEHSVHEVAIADSEWKLLNQRTIGDTVIDFFQLEM